jgi:hypothetical protein
MVISSQEIHTAHETAVSFRLAAAKYIGKPSPTQGIGTASEIRRILSRDTQEFRQPGKIYTPCISRCMVPSARG